MSMGRYVSFVVLFYSLELTGVGIFLLARAFSILSFTKAMLGAGVDMKALGA